MRTLSRAVVVLPIFLTALLFSSCNNDEGPGTPDLPSGCQSRGVNAFAVLDTGYTCVPTNAFMDPNAALGAPDAASTGPGKLEFKGFTSLGIDGSITLFTGSCIQDLSGPDLRVYQSVSSEALEVQVSANREGPFVSLGIKQCVDPPPFFQGFCEFDLAGSGVNNVRVVKIIDKEKLFFNGAACDNAGPSPGADIEAVEVVHPGT